MKTQTEHEEKLVEYLRKEAGELKDCFTQFSFQAIAVSSVALGVLSKFQPDYPLLGLASVCVILLALSVARIGVYKYTGANRVHGYELYLDRARRTRESEGWRDAYRNIGWEEALRAWRTVQPTVFRVYYHWGKDRENSLRDEFKKMEYPWFEPERLHVPGSVYYSGSYLRTMFSILFMLVAIGMASMIAMCIQLFSSGDMILFWPLACVTAATCVATLMKIMHLTQRRRLLESGFHCIHSNAVMWQLVVVAHHRALGKLGVDEHGLVASLQGYTRELSEQAAALGKYLAEGGSPHDWMHGSGCTVIPMERAA